jgi:hypothetical protein
MLLDEAAVGVYDCLRHEGCFMAFFWDDFGHSYM